MQRYETVIVLIPEIQDADQQAITGRLSQVIREKGGSIESVEEWGKKTLAYPINKKTEGIYLRCEYLGEGAVVNEVERTLRVNDSVLRFLTVRVKESKSAESQKEKREADVKERGIE